MNESVQNKTTQDKEPSAVVAVDAGLLPEALSAWMDGEALPADVDENSVLQWLLQDERAQGHWRQWHAHADYLHLATSDVHVAYSAGDLQPSEGDVAVGSAAWSMRLSQQLAQIRVGDGATNLAAAPMQAASASVSASVSAAASTPSGSGKPAVVTAGAAANDPVWRWKMAAGFASLAAVGVMVWNLLGQQPAAGGADALMAAHGSSAAVPAATVMQQEEGVLKAQEQQAQGLAASAEDPYTEALLLAHTQLGESLLLQDVLLTE